MAQIEPTFVGIPQYLTPLVGPFCFITAVAISGYCILYALSKAQPVRTCMRGVVGRVRNPPLPD
jgi:hypothetical protein